MPIHRTVLAKISARTRTKTNQYVALSLDLTLGYCYPPRRKYSRSLRRGSVQPTKQLRTTTIFWPWKSLTVGIPCAQPHLPIATPAVRHAFALHLMRCGLNPAPKHRLMFCPLTHRLPNNRQHATSATTPLDPEKAANGCLFFPPYLLYRYPHKNNDYRILRFTQPLNLWS